MADAIVSAVAEQLITFIKEQIQNEIHLLKGFDKEVLNLSDELRGIRIVLNDAENRRFQDNSVNYWLVRLEQTSYEMEDVLDEWKYAILKLKMDRDQSNDHAAVASLKQKVCSFIQPSCLCFKKTVVQKTVVRHDIAKKMQNVKAQLDEILKEKDRYNFLPSQPATDPSLKSWRGQSSSFVDLGKVHGRDREKGTLVSELIANGGSQEESGIRILSIVGVGGLGKTTLAQLVYNDSRVGECFDIRIWICVSDPFDEVGIAKGIIQKLRAGSCPDVNQLDMLLDCLRESISGKKFLLILDDVWTHDNMKWEPLENSLKSGGAGSKILVTTRNERVAKMMGTMDNDIHRPEVLSDEDCWLLLHRLALFGKNKEEFENFEDIGKKIAKKCNGLPLAAKTLGSLLRFKNTPEEWESVLNSEMWDIKDVNEEVFRHLFLTYNELSPTLKRCFSFCAVFPKDSEINVEKLIGYWMALGYLGSNISDDMELKGRECFNILGMHSLFQDFDENDWDGQIGWFKMHDIVHDFAQFVRKNGRTDDAGINKTSCPACDPVLVSTVNVNEFRSVIWDKRSPPNFCGCLTRLRVLSLEKCWSLERRGLPQGILENMIHLRWLSLSRIELSHEDLKIIFQLYNLQTLWLQDCGLQDIPSEIGNLIYLRHLNLSSNEPLRELPKSICGLRELRTLNIQSCRNLSGLPEGIHGLINLKHLFYWDANKLIIPEGLAKLTGLRTLMGFRGGSGWNKLELLKDLNSLGLLHLRIRLTNILEDGMVEDARKADLKKKIHIRSLRFEFKDEMDEKEESSVRMDILDALQPHPGLRDLGIRYYKGSKLPSWITSPLNRFRVISLFGFNEMSSLPSFGKLPFLEKICFTEMKGLQFVGREFLGITTAGGGGGDMVAIQSSSDWIAFPKLKKLTFAECRNWKKWEDITAEEEDSTDVLVMPCLTKLTIGDCKGLRALPRRLLRKVSSTLEKLNITGSKQLKRRYKNKDGSAWKSISQRNPRLQLKI